MQTVLSGSSLIVAEFGYALENGKLTKTNRGGRIIEHSIPSLLNDMSAERFAEFCKLYTAEYPLKVRVAYGDDIHEVFENYRPGSCMRYTEKRDMREVYANNPNKVCVAYLLKSDNPILSSDGSSLVWLGKEKIYLDRYYTNGFTYRDQLHDIQLAIASEFELPAKMVYGSHPTIEIAGTVNLTLNHNEDEPLPYSDSFRLRSHTDSTITLTTSDSDYEDELNDQGGTYPNGDGCRCYNCECRVDENEMRSNDNGNCYCENCFDELYSFCAYAEDYYPADEFTSGTFYCREPGYYRGEPELHETYVNDHSVRDDFTECEPDSVCEYCHDDYRVELTYESGYICPADFENDYTETVDGTICHVSKTVECADGEYRHIDDCQLCEDGEYYPTDDVFEWSNGEFHNEPENGLEPVAIGFRVCDGKRISAELCYQVGTLTVLSVDDEYMIIESNTGLSAALDCSNLELAKRTLDVFAFCLSSEFRRWAKNATWNNTDNIPSASFAYKMAKKVR